MFTVDGTSPPPPPPLFPVHRAPVQTPEPPSPGRLLRTVSCTVLWTKMNMKRSAITYLLPFVEGEYGRRRSG